MSIGGRAGALAGPSETLGSSTVKNLTSGPVVEDVGEREREGLAEPWRPYRVVAS